ncbi:MAG: hypothetical protein ACREM1_19925 [Longimicrobiales bacterium]
MRFVIYVIAFFGVLAVLGRVLRAVLRLAHRGVDTLVAGEVHDLRAQRGDLTGMADAARQRSIARRDRLVAVAMLSFWAGLLVAPPLTPWPAALYAIYSLLWLVPRARLRS